jgi:hypothetical protein
MSEPSPNKSTPESFDPLHEIETVLKRFDEQAEPFQEHQVWNTLCEVRKKLGEGVEIPLPLRAEMIAFEVNTVAINRENRQNSGLKECLTEDILAHWAVRARAVTNPLLKVTYADAHWHFASLINVRSPVDMAQIVIDASFEILETKRYSNSIEARWYAQRAIDLSLKLNDPIRKPKAIAMIIKIEEEISADEKPGLWGFAFDCLLANSKVQLDPATSTKLIQDLKERLERLTQPKVLHLSAAEAALTRLISHYSRLNLPEENKKHISTYAKAILLFADNTEQSAFTRAC